MWETDNTLNSMLETDNALYNIWETNNTLNSRGETGNTLYKRLATEFKPLESVHRLCMTSTDRWLTVLLADPPWWVNSSLYVLDSCCQFLLGVWDKGNISFWVKDDKSHLHYLNWFLSLQLTLTWSFLQPVLRTSGVSGCRPDNISLEALIGLFKLHIDRNANTFESFIWGTFVWVFTVTYGIARRRPSRNASMTIKLFILPWHLVLNASPVRRAGRTWQRPAVSECWARRPTAARPRGKPGGPAARYRNSIGKVTVQVP